MPKSPTPRGTLRSALPIVAVVALAACGGDDDASDDSDAETAATVGRSESGAPPTLPAEPGVATTLTPGGDEIDEVPADPGELPNPVATITRAGETFEAEGYAQVFDMESGGYVDLDGDFLICEAVNPAFEGDANIIVGVGDGLEFTFRVNSDEPYVQFGEEFFGDETNDVSFERDGNTIAGEATFAEAEPVSFDIDCG